uniref:Uncharacterized protein n=1 Tax=Timema tahoe TaxID=61484 RepID=A0A7R9IGT9_9NEOP|nr:unnamed protein product [Timema tahoe]
MPWFETQKEKSVLIQKQVREPTGDSGITTRMIRVGDPSETEAEPTSIASRALRIIYQTTMKPPQFGADITNQTNNETNLPAVMHCTRIAGRAIIRVVGRCNDALENSNLGSLQSQSMECFPFLNPSPRRSAVWLAPESFSFRASFPHREAEYNMADYVARVVLRCEHAQDTEILGSLVDLFENMSVVATRVLQRAVLFANTASRYVTDNIPRKRQVRMTSIVVFVADLSECQLMQVPDAVYHLMRHTTLKGCNLSSNVITKIPPKFAVKFSFITGARLVIPDLNLSHNQLSKLPDELADLEELEKLDISHNAYIALPSVVFKISKLTHLQANNNHIVDVEVERLQDARSLQEVDLQNNPVTSRSHDALLAISAPRVLLSPREREDWEDLTV